jgi:hypothetical protein
MAYPRSERDIPAKFLLVLGIFTFQQMRGL